MNEWIIVMLARSISQLLFPLPFLQLFVPQLSSIHFSDLRVPC